MLALEDNLNECLYVVCIEFQILVMHEFVIHQHGVFEQWTMKLVETRNLQSSD